MLKKYRISVDGKSYEVEVEDMATGTSSIHRTVAAPAANAAAHEAAPAAVPESAPAKEAPKAKPAVAPSDIKGEVLRAPMPGTILSVSAAAGQQVKRGDILLILEAMKMENEIVAHIDGTVAAIYVQKGSSVNAGDTLVSFA
jgi:glutaconyl-CoA/methylmalonyl-CoA decarboxylase subunit gamma